MNFKLIILKALVVLALIPSASHAARRGQGKGVQGQQAKADQLDTKSKLKAKGISVDASKIAAAKEKGVVNDAQIDSILSGDKAQAESCFKMLAAVGDSPMTGNDAKLLNDVAAGLVSLAIKASGESLGDKASGVIDLNATVVEAVNKPTASEGIQLVVDKIISNSEASARQGEGEAISRETSKEDVVEQFRNCKS